MIKKLKGKISTMKKTLLILTLVILFILSGTSAAVIAFVEIAPIYPEEKLFPLQNNLEHALLVFYRNSSSKSWYEIKILDKRVNDLESIAGMPEKVQRFNTVWEEVDHVLKRFQDGNSDDIKNLRFHFVKTLSKIQKITNQFVYLEENFPAEFLLAQEKLNQLKILAVDDSNPLSRTIRVKPSAVEYECKNKLNMPTLHLGERTPLNRIRFHFYREVQAQIMNFSL